MPDVSSTAPAQVSTWVAIDAHKLSAGGGDAASGRRDP